MNDELQRTDEWKKQRIGKFTASTISEIMKSGRSKTERFSKTALTYIREKIAEKLTGLQEEITGKALDWGTEYEPEAIYAYEKNKNVKIKEVGFIPLTGFEDWAGGSPDGLIDGESGIIEVKCPYTSKMHVETLLTNDIPEYYKDKYYAQMQMNMAVTNTEFCDFISYDPRMLDETKQLIVIRIQRDNAFILEMLGRLQEVIDYINSLEVLNNDRKTKTNKD